MSVDGSARVLSLRGRSRAAQRGVDERARSTTAAHVLRTAHARRRAGGARRGGAAAVRRALRIAIALAAVAAAAAAARARRRRRPEVRQLVVFRDGDAVTKHRLRARRRACSVGGRRCAAGAGTALAALVRSRPGRLRLRDFGSLLARARDGGGLFVARDPRRRATAGQNGWVYKVGRRGGHRGRGRSGGPFGSGRLRTRPARDLVLLPPARRRLPAHARAARLRAEAGARAGAACAATTTRARRPSAGATVSAGGESAATDANGIARLGAAAGQLPRRGATKAGLIRSFARARRWCREAPARRRCSRAAVALAGCGLGEGEEQRGRREAAGHARLRPRASSAQRDARRSCARTRP